MSELRPFRDDEGGSCDWGYCDDDAVCCRWAEDLNEWLPVCRQHTKGEPIRLQGVESHAQPVY